MTKPIIVQKYGGSSVADPGRLMHVARRVVAAKETGRRVVVVVSAMGDTTDELMGLAGQITDRSQLLGDEVQRFLELDRQS